MLTALSIRDVVLIESLDLEVREGFTALTGETGAGKSILLDALGLAVGARADRALVRPGAERALAAAHFAPQADNPVWSMLADHGVPAPPGGEIVLKRILSNDGRSRALINDEPVSCGLLRSVGGALLEVHGQHEGMRLLDSTEHRALLDAFAGAGELLQAVDGAFAALASSRAELAAREDGAAESARNRDWLTFAVAELERLDPQQDEEILLAAERAFLMGTEKLSQALGDATRALAEGGGVGQRLQTASRGLDRAAKVAGQAGAAAQTLSARLEAGIAALGRAQAETSEAMAEIDAAMRAAAGEPGRLEATEERLFALRAAARKHNVPVNDLADLRMRLTGELAALESGAERLAEARADVAAAETAYGAAAGRLSALRQDAARALEAALTAELIPLRLEKARFGVMMEPLASDKWGPAGAERVEFLIATNPGASLGPLSEIASGGELARFALALKVATARASRSACLVFDEVDQGVGGAVADAVGSRLARLTAHAQVLCVTHAPQVAARADHHWRIAKRPGEDGAMRTRVTALNPAQRGEEIARMLAGAEVTEEARAAARALMAAA
jgi:DNA repair protein RecN (Recombination protein N)